MQKIYNFLLFYVGWYICVSMHNILGAIIGLVIAVLNILIMRYDAKEIVLIFVLSLCGLLSEVLAYTLDVYKFTYVDNFIDAQNLWLVSLWILFMTTFGGSLKWLHKYSTPLLAILGLVGGVLSYYFAYMLDAIYFNRSIFSLIYIGIVWSILFPILFKVYLLRSK